MSTKRNETKEERKARKDALKAQKASKREGGAKDLGQKNCEICETPSDLLIRCQVDERAQWYLVCGKCWKTVSGGVVDGDKDHPHYKYGGLWKNRRKD
ncbi:hypothetical protein CYMTET_30186 [Cymbomonas tetramitiformis]|uniref:Uncharacterized protein n=1 Tax=Cymbomonas tetramitiformis TaxID=36881 RepID=A0AAE0FJZ9_9CHLO|nr:hypothetical protein CYMTET_30186 [Cymbomonas tetramitiformis]